MTVKLLKRRRLKKEGKRTETAETASGSSSRLRSRSSSLRHSNGNSLSLGKGSFDTRGVVDSFLRNGPLSSSSKSVFNRQEATYIRVGDLELPDCKTDTEKIAFYSTPSSESPPSLDDEKDQLWGALDDGLHGKHGPLVPAVCQALVDYSLASLLHESMWSPADSVTSKRAHVWQSVLSSNNNGPCEIDPACRDVLLWWGDGPARPVGLGSRLPVVRAAGLLDLPPAELAGLLYDSSRVKEYNANSLGRFNLVTFPDDPACQGKTAIMRSEVAVLRKTGVMTSLVHIRKLPDQSYIMTARAVEQPSRPPESNVITTTVLLGVYWMRPLAADPNKTVLVTLNHMWSPLVPSLLAKRVGLAGIGKLFTTLRTCYSASNKESDSNLEWV